MCILHFFDDNHIIIIEFHEELTYLLNKIFAKLKWSVSDFVTSNLT